MIRYLFLPYFFYWCFIFYYPVAHLHGIMLIMSIMLLLSIIFKTFLYSYNFKGKLTKRRWLWESFKSNLAMLLIAIPLIWVVTSWGGYIMEHFNETGKISILGFLNPTYQVAQFNIDPSYFSALGIIVYFPLYAYAGALLDYAIIGKAIGNDKKLYNLSFYINVAFYITIIGLLFVM